MLTARSNAEPSRLVLSKSYKKEYGEDTFQVQTEYIDRYFNLYCSTTGADCLFLYSFGQHAIVVDDILATGGMAVSLIVAAAAGNVNIHCRRFNGGGMRAHRANWQVGGNGDSCR